jgi:hypothetical protein
MSDQTITQDLYLKKTNSPLSAQALDGDVALSIEIIWGKLM